MTEPEIYAALTAIFHRLFGRYDITLQAGTTAAEVEGWDSFRQVEIILAVQRHYHRIFTAKELDGLETVGDLVQLIKKSE